MVDASRQLPSPEAQAWSINLAEVGGPVTVVCRREEAEAREALVHHLVGIGAVANTCAAERIVAGAPITSVAVVW